MQKFQLIQKCIPFFDCSLPQLSRYSPADQSAVGTASKMPFGKKFPHVFIVQKRAQTGQNHGCHWAISFNVSLSLSGRNLILYDQKKYTISAPKVHNFLYDQKKYTTIHRKFSC